ncbi:MAG: YraN family protein [Phycisphaerales bacterium]|nr:YraN family protein [Phycisphaerales bacterium]
MSGRWRSLKARLRAALGLGRAMPGGDAGRRDLGLRGERAAASYLKKQGFRIIQRNVRLAIGEADLVCLAPDRATVVLVEVKSRVLPADGTVPHYRPEDSITADKRRKLAAIGRWLARANGWEGRPMRIDAVAVEWLAGGRVAVVRHHESVAPIRAT